MCGIVGIVAKNRVNQEIYDALTVLQHRGQDAAGIVTSERGKFNLRKDNGLVRDVFHTRHMQQLVGNPPRLAARAGAGANPDHCYALAKRRQICNPPIDRNVTPDSLPR